MLDVVAVVDMVLYIVVDMGFSWFALILVCLIVVLCY